MKIPYIGEFCGATFLKSYAYFSQSTVGQFMTFTADCAVKTAKIVHPNDPVERSVVEEKDPKYNVFLHWNRSGDNGGFVAVLIADDEYPQRVAHQLLNKVAEEFIVKHPKRTWEHATSNTTLPFPELNTYIVDWQKPEKADAITRIQKELDETKIVLHQTIESVLERGQRIDELVAKSDNLSAQSKLFFKTAKNQNSCCVVM
ncbi:synaptobrevin [Mytilinidion resinicola]|uniref:Synaptobrevin homolog YKT6 n=1 Tax=Mytilinidion resinicola TaxID=574789 RepID=A0A6A6Z328_9PEZI|nr:synaptobrevin [Mytilinidion resinicola]KAF2815400.1 synaptobrevin [Mytilinidion resinicola]